MHFHVEPACLELGLRAGAVVFRGVRVGPAAPELRTEITREAAAVSQRFAGPAEIRNHPSIAAFQDILRQVGVNPRREQNSVERLLSFAYKRGDLPAIKIGGRAFRPGVGTP